MRSAFRVEILKQLLARQILAFPDDPGEARVVNAYLVNDAGLAAKVEIQLRAGNFHVPVFHRRQSDGAVLLGVFLVADTDQRLLQKCDNGGKHLLPRQAGQAQIAAQTCPQTGQGGAELDHVFIFVGVAHLAPARMVTGLLAAAGVAPGGLKVSTRIRANPDVGPGRRNGQLANAL